MKSNEIDRVWLERKGEGKKEKGKQKKWEGKGKCSRYSMKQVL